MHYKFEIEWYQTVVAIVIIPIFAVAIMQAVGMSDWNVSSAFGKLLMFVFGAWNSSSGEIIPSLGLCMVTIAGCSCAADLMQDFKTGYLLGAKPTAMFFAQMIGAAFGVVVAPAVWTLFTSAYDIPCDAQEADCQVPGLYGPIYRILAIIATGGGGSALPPHIFEFMAAGAGVVFLVNCFLKFAEIKGFDKHPLMFLIPAPITVGIGFLIPPGLSLEMGIGGFVAWIWDQYYPDMVKKKPFIASGFIAGAGIAVLVSVILTLAGITEPITVTYKKSP